MSIWIQFVWNHNEFPAQLFGSSELKKINVWVVKKLLKAKKKKLFELLDEPLIKTDKILKVIVDGAQIE